MERSGFVNTVPDDDLPPGRTRHHVYLTVDLAQAARHRTSTPSPTRRGLPERATTPGRASRIESNRVSQTNRWGLFSLGSRCRTTRLLGQEGHRM